MTSWYQRMLEATVHHINREYSTKANHVIEIRPSNGATFVYYQDSYGLYTYIEVQQRMDDFLKEVAGIG